jgi:hypothetical protein
MTSEEIVADIRDFMAKARAVDPYPLLDCAECKKNFLYFRVVWHAGDYWCSECFRTEPWKDKK